jgi:hypothetical protein
MFTATYATAVFAIFLEVNNWSHEPGQNWSREIMPTPIFVLMPSEYFRRACFANFFQPAAAQTASVLPQWIVLPWHRRFLGWIKSSLEVYAMSPERFVKCSAEPRTSLHAKAGIIETFPAFRSPRRSGFVLTYNSEAISIVFVVCRSLARIGLELEIVNSDGCRVRGSCRKGNFFGCGGLDLNQRLFGS